MKKQILISIISCLVLGCGTLGEKTPGPQDLPNNGVGPFRLLDGSESSSGNAILSNAIIDNGMAVEAPASKAVLFFTTATAGTRTSGSVEDAPYLDHFVSRSISRSEPSSRPTFQNAASAFTASADWEGGEVFDPWVVVLPNGAYRLYYAGAGGLGVAASDTVDGEFHRLETAPFLGTSSVAFGEDHAPRHPTVVQESDGYTLYFQAGHHIGQARSVDGFSWSTPVEVPVALTLGADAGVDLEGYGSPSAIVVHPTEGAPYVHIFFEAFMSDGTRRIGVVGTRDHSNFESALIPLIGKGKNQGAPAPYARAENVTMLYFTADQNIGGASGRMLFAGVSPGVVRFPLSAGTP